MARRRIGDEILDAPVHLMVSIRALLASRKGGRHECGDQGYHEDEDAQQHGPQEEQAS